MDGRKIQIGLRNNCGGGGWEKSAGRDCKLDFLFFFFFDGSGRKNHFFFLVLLDRSSQRENESEVVCAMPPRVPFTGCTSGCRALFTGVKTNFCCFAAPLSPSFFLFFSVFENRFLGYIFPSLLLLFLSHFAEEPSIPFFSFYFASFNGAGCMYIHHIFHFASSPVLFFSAYC